MRVRKAKFLAVWAKCVQTLALAVLAMGTTKVWAQPTNDNFADAIILSGIVGQTTGDNSNATLEVGEPNPISTPVDTPLVGASVWYQWIAPLSGTVTFDTIGSDFDTVLAVYTGGAVNSLTQVVADDDSGGNLTSKVSFTAVQGTTYYISVNGFDSGFGAAEGDIALNWNAAGNNWAGQFRLTSTGYTYSQNESTAPQSANMTFIPARATVTRVKGYAGKVNVGYTLTTAFYTNIYATNFFGTIDTNGVATTNVAIRLLYENYNGGFFYSVIDLPGFSNGVVVAPITNAPFCPVPTSTPSNFCYTVFGTNYLPTANIPGGSQTGTLVFNDWQMSADISIPASVAGFAGANGLVIVNINTNSTGLDPLEDQSIPAPTIDASRSSAYVMFLNTSGVVPGTPGLNPTTNTVFNFERATIRCSENVGTARVAVLRTGTNFTQGATLHYVIDTYYPPNSGAPGRNNQFALQPGSDYATPDNADKFSSNVDFTSVNGTLTWGANDGQPKFITIPVNDDNLVEFNEDVYIQFDQDLPANAPQGGVYGNMDHCTLTILFDNRLSNLPDANGNWISGEQPAGAVDRSYNPDNWPTTALPNNPHPGANGTVYAVAVQPDDSTVIAGDFTAYNSTTRSRIARVKFNGMLDTTFNPGSGADGFINNLALDSSGRIIAVGGFGSINGSFRSGIARLNTDGSLDSSFDPQFGADQPVLSSVIQPDGQILIAGEFTSYNLTNRNGIARLNPDGSLDTSFDPGDGPNGIIYSAALQPDGKVIIVGDFTSVDGVSLNRIARLNADGTLDTTFNGTGFGADDIIYAAVVQPDGKILIGGAFNQFNQLGGKGIARLNPDGSVDTSFDVGVGADDIVYTLTLQNDGKILVGGVFKNINFSRRVSFARLDADGAVDADIMDTAYNQFAGLINPYHDPNVNSPNPIYSIGVQSDDNIIIGGTFSQVGGGFTREDVRPRSNVARLIGGATPGSGTIELASSYTADSSSSRFFVTVTRTNGTLGTVSAQIQAVPLPPGPGAAVYGVDYTFNSATPTWTSSWGLNAPSTWMLSDGLSGPNNDELGIDGTHYLNPTVSAVYINIISNNNADATLNLKLAQPIGTETFSLGGVNIPLGVTLGTSLAPLTIVHNNNSPGTLSFSSTTYTTNENAGNAVITVTRTGGTAGTVTVKYSTTTNGTARAGVDYTSVSGKLTFFPGQTNQTFTVPLIDNTAAQPDRTVGLSIFTTSGGALLGNTNAQLVIVDNDFAAGHVSFSASNFGANENVSPAVISVVRLGGSLNVEGVTVAVTAGSAVNGVNFAGSTNVLTWASGDVTAKTISIPVFDDGIVTSNLTVNLRLLNGTVNGTNNNLVLGGIFTNAILEITNTDAVGFVGFSSPTYSVNENGGAAIFPIVRTGGLAQSISVNIATVDGTAVDGVDYHGTNGVLTFAPGEVSKLISVPIVDNGTQDPSRFFTLVLSNAIPTNALGANSLALVNIVDDESFNQPAGQPDTTYSSLAGFNDSVFTLALQADGNLLAGGDFTVANGVPRNRIARLKPDGTLDSRFSNYLSTSGANGTVRAILQQTDGRILVAGFFTSFNNVVMNRIARLNLDGSLDSSFNPGSGGNSPIYALGENFVNGQRRIVVGGAFTLINGVTRNSIAQLTDSGAVDTGFNPGSGANGTIYAVGVQSDGKILIGGDFTSVNGSPLNHIARLNSDGSVDATFHPGAGANDSVRAIAIQLDGRILIGGLFTNVNGTALSHIARLNGDGGVDSSFTPGIGANDNVDTIALQSDARIILGGDFTRCSGVTRNRITRLDPDGTVDPTINFGTGADASVSSAVIQADGNIVLGGSFDSYDDQPYPHIVRVYGGSIAGSGAFEFTSATYQTTELSSNVVVKVRRTGGTSGPNPDGSGSILVPFATSDGSAVAGVNYSALTTNLVFPAGEVEQTLTLSVADDGVITPDLTFNLTLSTPTPAGGIGNQPFATVIISNDDSGLSFSSSAYSVAKNIPNGVATISIVRQGSAAGSASVIFMTTTNGTAVQGTDYTAVSNLVTFAPGIITNNITIPIITNGLPEGNRTVTMTLTNAVNLSSNTASLLLLPPSDATLTIIDTVTAPGQLMFAQTNYVFTEGNSNAVITVLRTNGTSGTVSVTYRTIAGTAQPGVNYTSASSTLTFANGETMKSFNVPMLDNGIVQGPVTLSLVLSNATGGATLLQPTNVPMTILDNDTGIAFSSAGYVVNETNGSVTLSVLRLNTTNGTVQVSYATTNGTALAGTNYTATSGTLTFNPGETTKSVIIPILHDLRATSNLIFGVNLSNPSAGAQLTFPSSASVIVLDAEAGIGFTNSTFGVLKNATNVVLAVFCSNPNVEPVSVNYSTADGTAVAGTDYTATTGVLTFTNGAVTNFISVPIINNSLVEGDRTFTVSLSSPTSPGQLVAPSTASVTITDINSGFSFSSPTYTVLKSGVQANITVIRVGYTNSSATVNYATQDGTGTNGVDYIGVSGTLTFTNGVTSQNFSVPVIDSTTVKPDKTVLLQLSNPIGTNAVLVAPSAAVLTIHDNSGSLVVPAGAALIGESGPVNGVIDPNETVTMLFALRNEGGTNTANLVATLLATNGITAPSSAQNYGALINNGPSISRQYQFTASGTNGQVIAATFQLQDGAANVGTATFTFVLGNTTMSFTNPAAIVINDNTNASPYPATNIVSGVGGSLSKATISLKNVYHTWASDVDALLVSPAGQKMLVMANAGGSFPMNNATLAFDDAASAYLPQSSQISSGTNKPTTYTPVATFPSPAPAAPYATNLATFAGSNPNGVWSLYVIDDSPGNMGIISNGWVLNITSANVVSPVADLALGMTASTGAPIVSNNFSYTITVTNYGPSPSTGVTVTDNLPGNVSLVSSNATQGGVSIVGSQITWTVGGVAMTNGASLTITVRPNSVGAITNAAFATANEADPNANNNSAAIGMTVGTATADLSLAMVGAPDPILIGNTVTYTLTVSNAGPATATGVAITNTLPPAFSLISATPSGGYTLAGNVLTFTNLGNIPSGSQVVATIVIRPTAYGTITNTALATSQITDPLKVNNSATVKIIVQPLVLGTLKTGANLVLSWTTNFGGNLESTTNLNQPAVWTPVTSPSPVIIGGQYVITNSIGSGSKYFRLHGP
jgi:uncharacterized delta-60 repeat protein/uncharacterized repeat protein (TIGR01451 family)